MARTFKDLTNEEFRNLLENLDEESLTDLADSTFFETLAAIDEAGQQQVVELTGKVLSGRLVLNEPSPLPVDGNTIRVGHQTIVITLEPLEPAQQVGPDDNARDAEAMWAIQQEAYHRLNAEPSWRKRT